MKLLACSVGLMLAATTLAGAHTLQCPDGPLAGVDVLSAKHGEAIDEAYPPTLVPDEQTTRAGVVHQVWRMNGEGPDWDYFVWCRYQQPDRLVKLPAPKVTRCERTFPATHPDRPPQQMVCD